MELPLEYYAAILAEFAKVKIDELKLDANGNHALFRFQGKVHLISHSADIEADYRKWFACNHDLLFTELPSELWNDFLNHMNPFSDDFLIDLYESWKIYWAQQALIYEQAEQYAASMDKAHNRFELLCEKLRKRYGRPVELAWEIDDLQLVPVVALAVKRHYDNDADFYRTCVAWMTSKYHDQLGDGFMFTPFLVPVSGYDKPQAFFVYTIDEPFL